MNIRTTLAGSLVATAALVGISLPQAASAHGGGLSFNFGFGAPYYAPYVAPAYVAPAPVYPPQYYYNPYGAYPPVVTYRYAPPYYYYRPYHGDRFHHRDWDRRDRDDD